LDSISLLLATWDPLGVILGFAPDTLPMTAGKEQAEIT